MLSSSSNPDPALPLPSPVTHIRQRSNFYVITAVVALLLVLAGFSLTYFIPILKGSFTGRPLLHVHGLVFMTWMLLFIAQPLLVRTGNVNLHRKLGVAGFVLAGAMFITGITVAMSAARINDPAATINGLTPRLFLLIPLTDMLLFAMFIAVSLANLARTEWHKRLMVLSTVAILPAATGRLALILGMTNPFVIMTLQEVIVVAAIVHDWRTKKKVHPVYIWGGLFMFVIHLIRMPLAGTQWWASVATWLAG